MLRGIKSNDPGDHRRQGAVIRLTDVAGAVGNHLLGEDTRTPSSGFACDWRLYRLWLSDGSSARRTEPERGERGRAVVVVWPGWRGPHHDGHSSDPRAPLQ